MDAGYPKPISIWGEFYRGHPTVRSGDICSEDLLSPTIFGLIKCDDKLEYFLAQIFVIWGK